jgi:hypothetical protein
LENFLNNLTLDKIPGLPPIENASSPSLLFLPFFALFAVQTPKVSARCVHFFSSAMKTVGFDYFREDYLTTDFTDKDHRIKPPQ